MSIFRLPQLRNLASGVDRIRDRFLGRRADSSVTERAFRRLAVDALEERHLLSVSPMGPVDHLVNQTFWGDATETSSLWHNYTTMGQSVAVDHDGDFVVTWTRYDLVVDPNTGEFIIDPKTGEYMTDANIYARYFTDETQRVTLPDALGVDNVPGNFFSTFSLRVGGNEIQKISFSTAALPYWPQEMNATISGTLSVGFDVNGDGSISAGESFTMFYDELDATSNANQLQMGLRGLGGALSDVVVQGSSPKDYYVYFGDQSGGLNQPEIVIDPAFTTWTSGFYPGVLVGTVREPLTVSNIPMHPTDPWQTALAIEEWFYWQSGNRHDAYQSPTQFVWTPEYNYTEPDTVRYANYQVSVMPVLDPATGQYSLTSFDITFIDESGKQNIGEMAVVKAVDDFGVSHLGSSQINVTTIKEPSPEFRVNDPEPDNPFTPYPDQTNQVNPAVAMDADGDFVITWTSYTSGANNPSISDIYARRFSPTAYKESPDFVTVDGTDVYCVQPLGNSFRVNTVINGQQDQPAIGMDYDGNFTIAWVSTAQDLSFNNHVSFQRYNRDGDRLGSETIVLDPTGVTDTSIHFDPYVAMSEQGHLLLAWCETDDPNYLDPDVGFWSVVAARLYLPDMSASAAWYVSDRSADEADSGSGGYPTADFDADGNFVIGYSVIRGTDPIGGQRRVSVQNYGVMYALDESNLVEVRNEFRVNSAELTSTPITRWSGHTWGSQLMLDADGDITGVYEGFGTDVSDSVFMVSDFFANWINANKNADLLPYLGGLFSEPTPELPGHIGDYTDMDSVIEYVLATAVSSGASAEQIGRLNAVLATAANMLRGEANGVFFSSYDAAWQPGSGALNVLAQDSVVNNQRDGQNTRYILQLDSRADSGDISLRIGRVPNDDGTVTGAVWTNIEINLPYLPNNGPLNSDRVPVVIEDAIEDAINAYWPDNLWSGTVTVRRIDNILENSIRMGTPWAWPDNQGFYVAYEISFAGDMHDIDIALGLGSGGQDMEIGDVRAAAPVFTQFAYGNDGQYQGEASAAMQPNGSFVVAWTAWEEMTDGTPGATNIYFREFKESTDNVGPKVTDFLLADGSRLKQGGQVQDPMQYVVVTFTEAMNTASATHSVLNPQNWSLINVETGAEINGGISQILYGMNISVDMGLADVGSNKWEAVLVIDANGAATPGTTPLTNGHYRIVAKNSLRDVHNNPLNSNGYDTNGGNFARDFHITTNPQTDIPVNPTSPGDQFLLDPSVTNTANLPNSPQSIAGDADGRHVIVWTDEGTGQGVFARLYNVVWTETTEGQRLSTTTALTEFRVTDNPTAVYAAVAMDGDGDFVVTWSQNDGTPSQPDWNVWYRRYDATGQPLDAARMANSHTAGTQRFSAVAMDVDGDFVITWQSHGQDGSGYGIYAQRFARSGELIGGLDEIQVLEFNGDPDMVSFALNFDGGVTGAIVYTGDLGDVADRVEQEFALLGVEVDAWVMSNREVAIRFLGADGRTNQAPILIDFVTVVGDAGAGLSIRTEVEGEIGEFLVNDTTLGDQVHPSIAMDASGSFVISWTSFGQDGDAPYQSNIYAKQFASNDVVAAGSASAAWVGAVNADTPPVVGIGPAIVTTGDPEDYEVGPGYDGVGRVQAGSGMGTGSLLMSGYHVITAAHVVADDFGNALPVNTISVTFNLPEGNLTINAVEVYIHPDYNGNFAAGGDIAIIVLAEAPPATVERYDIYRGANQIGSVFEKWGYGRSGTGQTGSTLDAGTERRGWNRYEMFSREFGGAPDGLAYDFDSGAAANDAFGIIWGRNDLGLGDDEAMTAQGDSGGPNFINGLIAGITSYHTTYGSANGDIDGQLNSSFGEIGVDVDVSLYANWIDAAMRGTPEMRINQTVAGNQKWSSVAMDADGDFVITWTSYGQDGTGSGPGSGVNGENGVYARRFNKDSSPVSDEFQVNTFTDKNQQRSRVAMDADGDFIITWESFQDRPTGAGPDAPTSYGVYARRYVRTSLIGMSPSYGPNGELGGELRMNTETAGDQRYPAVTLSDTGDAVFVWSGNGPGDAQGIFTKRLFKEIDDAGPMVTDVHTVVTDGSSVQLDVVGEDTIIYTTVNRFVVTFGEELDITHGSRGAQSVLNPDHWQVSRVHDDGTIEVIDDAVVTVEFGLNKAFDKGLAATPSGKFEAIVSFDGDAKKAGIQALEDGKYILTIKQNITDIFDNPLDGNFDGAPGGDYLLPFTVLTSASEIRVNGNPLGDQTFTDESLPISETPNSPRSVASDADGDYAVVWTSEGVNTGVYVKLYDTAWLRESDGTRTPVFNTKQPINPATGLPWVNGEILVTDNPTATHASIAMDADGDFVVTWSQNDGTTASPDWNVYAQWYTAEGMPKGVTNETQVVALDADVTGSFALDFNGATTALISWTGDLAATAASLQTQLNALGLNTIVRVCGDVELSVTFLGVDGAKDQPEFTVAQVNPGAMNVSVTTAWDGKGADAPFRVNTYTSRDQKFSSVAMDHDGEFVITWQSESQNGSGHEIYAQTYDRFAKPLGMRDELQVISFGATSSGTFTLIYEGLETGVIVYNGDTAQTAAAIQGALDSLGLQTRVVAMGDRDIEILFTGEDGGQNHRQLVLKAGTINNATVKTSQDGKTGEFRVNQAIAGDQVHPAVAMDAVGNFVVTWSSYDTNTTDNDAANIYARQFVWIDNENTGDNEDEHFGGGEFIVNQTLVGEQRWSDVAMDQQGDFVVTWTSVAPIPAGEEETVGIDGLQDVFARRYAFTIAVGGEVPVSNTPVSDEFLVNTYSRGTQQHSSVSMDADGDFVIVWESFQDWPIATSGLLNQPNSLGIQAQAFLANDKIDPVLNPTGRLGGEYAVNGTTDGPQRLPSVALDDTGDVVIVWSGNGQMVGQEDSQGIFMRRVNHADLNDTAGPTVTDVHVVDKTDGEPTEARVVLEGSVIDNYVGQMVVTFSEDLNTLYGDIGAHSILNPDLWILEKNGRVVEDAVNKIQFGLNLAYTLGLADSPSGKYEAIVTFDLGINEPGLQPLDNGTYVLRLNDDLMDLFGNMLDGNLDGVPGNDFNFAFSIIVGGSQDNPIDPPGPDSPLSDGRTFPESSDAVAVDSDGDYVVAWSAFDAAHQADRVQIRLFDAGGAAATARIAVTPEAAFDGDVQRYASVAMDGDGDFVVTWTNYRDADGVAGNGREEVDIYARRYSADGTPKEEAFRVNSYTTNSQQWSAAAMDIDGDFIIVWSSYGQEDNNQLGRGYGVFAQRYDSFGRAIGSEFQVNTTTAGDQKFPSVAMDAVGSFVIVWQSAQNAIGDDIVAREFNADGSPTGGPLGGEFLVNDTVAGNQRWPDVAMNLAGDGYAVTWSSSQQTDDQSGYGVYSKTFTRLAEGDQSVRYTYQGGPVDFGEGQTVAVPIDVDQDFVINDLNVRLTISHEDPSDLFVWLVNPNGDAILLAYEVPRAGDQNGVGAAGTANGANFEGTLFDDDADILITDQALGALPPFSGTFRPVQPLALFNGTLARGTWLLVVQDNDPADDPDVYFDGDGNRLHYPDGGRVRDWSLEFTRDPAASNEILVNTTTDGNQMYSSVAMDYQGNFVVTWSGVGNQPGQEDQSLYGVFSQRFNAAASKEGGETRLNTTTEGMQWLSSVGMDGEGNYVAVWTGDTDGGSSTTIFGYVSANREVRDDLVGPIVTDVLTEEGSRIFNGSVIVSDASSPLTTLVVAFGEELSIAERTVGGNRTPAIESVLNPSNWMLERNGMEIVGGISQVDFVYNSTLRRWEAVLTLDDNGVSVGGQGGLSSGSYVLSISDLVTDVFGNRLDGDYDGQPETNPGLTGYSGYQIEFSVAGQDDAFGAERRANQNPGYVQTLSEPLGTGYARETSNRSIAVDNDGDYVVVWTSYGQDDPSSPNGAGVYARRYDRNDNPIGDEFRVNNLTAGDQKNASIAMDADGDFIVVWEAKGADGTWDVYAQRFDAAGNRIANERDDRLPSDPYRNQSGAEHVEILVNTTRAGEQFNPSVAVDSYGNYAIAWGSSGVGFTYYSNVHMQVFDYRGEPVGVEVQVNEPGTGANGGWSKGFKVNPDIAMDADGDIVVAWDEATQVVNGVVIDTVVMARMFDRLGMPPAGLAGVIGSFVASGGEGIGGTDVQRMARNPSVARDPEGNFVIAYEAFTEDFDDGPESYNIFFSRFLADGTAMQVGAGPVNTIIIFDPENPVPGGIQQYFSGPQVNPSVAIAANGDFLITWNGSGAEHDALNPAAFDTVANPDSAGVWGKWFHAADPVATPVVASGQIRMNMTAAGVQQFGSVAMTPDGDAFVAWMGAGVGDQHGIFSRSLKTTADSVGPMATEIRYESSPGVFQFVGDGDNIFGNPQTLLVVFNEELNTDGTGSGGSPGLNSVENTANWALVDGQGDQVSGVIHDVVFYFDTRLNKWVAAVTFTGPDGDPGALTNGTYTLFASSRIQDVAGNSLRMVGYRPNATGRRFDEEAFELIYDPANGFGFQFTVNNTFPGDPSPHDVDQLVSTVGVVVVGQDDIGMINYQEGPDVARNAHGDYVVVWVEYSQVIDATDMPFEGDEDDLPIILAVPPLSTNIMAQRFGADGRERGEAILVNTLTVGMQSEPAVAIDDAGNFVVVWSGDGFELGDESGIFGQRFDADGGRLGGQFRINQFTTSGVYGVNTEQDEPAVAMNPNNGDFVVSWTSFGQDGSQDGVYARMYRANGSAQGNEFLVNATTVGAQGNSGVAMDGLGNFVVTWQSEHDTSGLGVYAQRFNNAGTRLGGEFRVNTYRNGDQDSPAVAMDRQGNFVIVWASRQDGSGYGVYGQIYNAAGTTVGGEFRVNQTTIHDQFQPDVAMTSTLVDGQNYGFVVTWTSFNQDSLPNEPNHRDYGIYARMYNLNGTDFVHSGVGTTPVGEFRVNAQTMSNQYASAVSMDADGHYVVVWAGVSSTVDTFELPPEGAENDDPIPVTIDITAIYSRYIDPPVQEGAGATTSTELVLTGTSGNDLFEFVGGPVAGAWIVKLNGVVQSVPSTTTTVRFDGLGGTDTVVFTGSAADDTVELWPTRGVLSSINYTVTVENVESITASGGGGNDAAILHDSAGDDAFTGRKAQSSLTGAGFNLVANAFETVEVRSEAGGYDQAALYDAAGDDTFTASHQSAKLTDGAYTIDVKAFDNVRAFATAGGLDTAQFSDSSGNDRFESTAGYAQLRDDQSTYYLYAEGFDRMVVASTAGGSDTAKMYGSSGNDTFKADRTYAQFQGDGFYCRADGFSFVLAYGQGGTDTAQLYDSAGDDTFVAGPNYGALSGSGYKIQVDSFRYVTGYGSQGNDLAVLYDSAGNDTLLIAQNYAQLSSNAYSNRAHGFRQVDVFGREEDGGQDQAVLYDSAMADHLAAADNWVELSNDQFNYWACCFESVTAKSKLGGDDTKDVASELDFVLAMEGNWRDR